MKNLKFGSLITLFAIALFIFSCGSDTGSQEGDAGTTTETEATMEAGTQAVDKNGKEYTSTYVCPMHCKGSGSDIKGTCPVCGMEYVASADLKEVTGEDEDEDEEGHEGHNH